MTPNTLPTFLPLTGLYEPSAIAQLADGRFLIVEDEKKHSFSVVTLGASGVVKHTPLGPGWFESDDDFWKLDDLEGLALDNAGYLYAVTSHSRDEEGMEKKSRDRLVRFRLKGNRVVAPLVFHGLKRALVGAYPLLAGAAQIGNVKADGGLNIEALEVSADQRRLLIGFRSPLQHGHAIIASVENLQAVFEAGAAPQVSSTLQALDLGGHGIRGMAYVAALQGYLVIGGPVSGGPGAFTLWFWSGQSGAPARRVTVRGLPDIGRAEGVCPAVVEGEPRIVIVSDDGKRKEGRFANFLLLDPGQLQIEP